LKRNELLKMLAKAGFTFEEGGNHTLVCDGKGNAVTQVPRHNEIKKGTALKILKQCGLKP